MPRKVEGFTAYVKTAAQSCYRANCDTAPSHSFYKLHKKKKKFNIANKLRKKEKVDNEIGERDWLVGGSSNSKIIRRKDSIVRTKSSLVMTVALTIMELSIHPSSTTTV